MKFIFAIYQKNWFCLICVCTQINWRTVFAATVEQWLCDIYTLCIYHNVCSVTCGRPMNAPTCKIIHRVGCCIGMQKIARKELLFFSGNKTCKNLKKSVKSEKNPKILLTYWLFQYRIIKCTIMGICTEEVGKIREKLYPTRGYYHKNPFVSRAFYEQIFSTACPVS